MYGCGCRPVDPVLETEITDDIFISGNTEDYFPLTPETDINALKEKIICDFEKILTRLEHGSIPDLKFLLNEIAAVDTYKEIKNSKFVVQYFLNNDLIYYQNSYAKLY